MSILVSGSIAYDHIMSFSGRLKEHILPESIHVLNLSFAVGKLRKNFGGTAGNIAYNLSVLGGDPLPIGPLGNDGKPYKKYLKKIGINVKYIPIKKEDSTTTAYIITDQEDNQIAAFYPGIATQAHTLSVHDVTDTIDLAIIAPANKTAMQLHARECYEKNISIVFDPGQQLTSFTRTELQELIGSASFLISNDYELRLIEDKTGWGIKKILAHVDTVITTLGPKGSRLITKNKSIVVPALKPKKLIDPTGAGDAYRAGFFQSYLTGALLEDCARAGSTAAIYAVEYHGTQNPAFTLKGFKKRFSEGYKFDSPL